MSSDGRVRSLATALGAASLFLLLVLNQPPRDNSAKLVLTDRVVVSAPIQLLLAGGDRFLAANFEAFRATSTLSGETAALMDDVSFRIRAHRVVAQLNPCHEDNYYLANGMLSWGGAPDDAIYILRRATECRIWDETPAFFYGFNLWFFRRDVEGGRKALELAAERTVANAAIFRRMAVMIEAETYRDERAALRFLEHERDQAADEKLKEMLDRRVQRLAGLIGLRDAQARYEAKMGRRLAAPVTLVEEGFLSDFPKDPLGLGYEFVDGEFRLRSLKIPGMEDAK